METVPCFLQSFFDFCKKFFLKHSYLRSESVNDRGAQFFAEYFYRGLLVEGWTVSKSFTSAIKEISGHTRFKGEKNKFLLLPDNGAHDVTIKLPDGDGEMEDVSEPVPIGNLSNSEHLCEKPKKVIEIYRYLHMECSAPEVVAAVGKEGVGKSQVITIKLKNMYITEPSCAPSRS
jgi:hypothetical protein